MVDVETLSWALLEAKLAYYYPNDIHPSWKPFVNIEDVIYDRMEDCYKTLCKEKGIAPSASDTVGFDLNRPSCRLVYSKLNTDRLDNKSCIETVRKLLKI